MGSSNLCITKEHPGNWHILGDSKAIVDWANGLSSLQVSLLGHWCSMTTLLMERFSSIFIKHIFHELNGWVDDLSKKVVGDIEGLLYFEEQNYFIMISSGLFKLYKFIHYLCLCPYSWLLILFLRLYFIKGSAFQFESTYFDSRLCNNFFLYCCCPLREA